VVWCSYFIFLLLLFRFVVASHKANTIFGKLSGNRAGVPNDISGDD
jgi:hypothetical protein